MVLRGECTITALGFRGPCGSCFPDAVSCCGTRRCGRTVKACQMNHPRFQSPQRVGRRDLVVRPPLMIVEAALDWEMMVGMFDILLTWAWKQANAVTMLKHPLQLCCFLDTDQQAHRCLWCCYCDSFFVLVARSLCTFCVVLKKWLHTVHQETLKLRDSSWNLEVLSTQMQWIIHMYQFTRVESS